MTEKGMYVGKQISFSLRNLEIVRGYQYKTRRNFSATLMKIITEWDEMSIFIQKIKAEKLKEDMKKAEVIKE